MAKRVIPPIVDFVDPRRVPYDIMEDPRYNGKGPTPDWLARLELRQAQRPRWEKIWGKIRWTWYNRARRYLRPSTCIYRVGGHIARLRRGWGEWDLDQFTPHVLEYM